MSGAIVVATIPTVVVIVLIRPVVGRGIPIVGRSRSVVGRVVSAVGRSRSVVGIVRSIGGRVIPIDRRIIPSGSLISRAFYLLLLFRLNSTFLFFGRYFLFACRFIFGSLFNFLG